MTSRPTFEAYRKTNETYGSSPTSRQRETSAGHRVPTSRSRWLESPWAHWRWGTCCRRLEQVRCVWVTPLLRDDRLRAQIKQAKPRSLFVVGTADGHYD